MKKKRETPQKKREVFKGEPDDTKERWILRRNIWFKRTVWGGAVCLVCAWDTKTQNKKEKKKEKGKHKTAKKNNRATGGKRKRTQRRGTNQVSKQKKKREGREAGV